MKKLVWLGIAIAAVGVLFRTEEEEDGAGVLVAPFVLALGIECAVFLLRSSQTRLLGKSSRYSS